MGRISKTLGGYIWWTHNRGSFHYDVMVTLILAFIFLAPLKIDFKDKPATRNSHPNQITAYVDEQSSAGVVYEVPAGAISVQTAMNGPAAVDAALAEALRPMAGDVKVLRYEPVPAHGKLQAYRVWTRR